MNYCTLLGVKRKIKEDLYDETTLDAKITETDDPDVVAWINSVTRRSSDFTTAELTSTAKDVRLSAECYCAYRIMSEMLEGVGYDVRALADVRYKEAKEYITMYCHSIGIVPAFDLVIADGCVVDYAYAVSTDANSITG
jgi:hypothetical protein